MDSLIFIATAAVMGLVFISMLGLTLKRLWRRASPERAIVRTGGGKVLVTMTGGCLQVPIIHEVTYVNMATMRLDIERSGDRSLITKDRLRADANVAFFTRVSRTSEGVAAAAASLGSRTEDPEAIRKLIESKFDDVIRAVAMSMTLSELLDKRDEFRSKVLAAVTTDLEKNGLELESVSITTLNQTDLKHFKPDNVIDAEGLTFITQQTQNRKRERNAIERETEVAIAARDLEATQKRLTISQTQEQARLEQEEQVANMTAEQAARVAAIRAQREKESREAQISSERAIQQAEIQRSRDLEIAEQDRRIAVAQKSEEQSAADARANLARAEAVSAEQAVTTATEVAIAQRAKQIAVVAAEQEAEVGATQVRVAAKADREAAEDRAQALLTEAKAGADAAELNARGIKAKALAEAEGKAAVNEADNKVSPQVLELRRALAAMQALPAILEQQMKPLEKMTDFKVVHIGGNVPGGAQAAGGAVGASNSTFTGQVLDAVQQYRMQSPIIDRVLKEAGLVDQDGRITLPAAAAPVDSTAEAA